MAKVIYEFDMYEDRENIEMFSNVGRMYDALYNISRMVKNELKHGDEELSDHIDRLLDDIKDESSIIDEWD